MKYYFISALMTVALDNNGNPDRDRSEFETCETGPMPDDTDIKAWAKKRFPNCIGMKILTSDKPFASATLDYIKPTLILTRDT